MKIHRPIFFALALLTADSGAAAVTYEVGPGEKFSAIADVPWEKLLPGDTVLIHARPEPYKEKFVLCRTGKPDAPITVRGVPDADGNLPVINGDGATSRPALNFSLKARSIIKIGDAQLAPDVTPQYLVIENLDVRGARPPHTFTDAQGKSHAYLRNAAAIHIEKGEHITIRHCILHDCGNGLFVSSSDRQAARDILVEGNYIFGNGNERSGQEHNVYSAAIGIVFQFNRFGPLRENCLGNNLKDRSAGLVVRYNWIEGGNQELDLVDAEDSALIRRDPAYRATFVYGNVFLKLPADEHPFLVHYGGDSLHPDNYREGTLYFYHNTIVSYRPSSTILLRLSSDEEHCDFRNNLVQLAAPKGRLALAESAGKIEISHNWFNPGWEDFAAENPEGEVHDDRTSLTGMTPGFVDLTAPDFRLTTNSLCRGAGEALTGEPFQSHRVQWQYVKHQSGEPRVDDDRPDLGAYSSPRSVSPSSSSPR